MLMGLFDGIKNFASKQWLDRIEWENNDPQTMVYKFPMQDNEIQQGSKLVVRQGQTAIFVNQGKIADVFTEGTHTLETGVLPILGDLKGWAFGFKSPFTADVYFVNTTQFISQKWGTPAPILISDPKFEQVQIRAFGTFGFKITNPTQFIQQVSGTNENYTADLLRDQLKSFIITNFGRIVKKQNVTVSELLDNYDIINQSLMNEVLDEFSELGLGMTIFTVESITLPEELQKMLDQRTQINMMGGMQNYAQVKTLDAMSKSVENPGMNSMNQMGMGLGMGVGMGQMFTQNMSGGFNSNNSQQGAFYNPQQQQSQQTNQSQNACTNCHTALPEGVAFCSKCGTKAEAQPQQDKFCNKCGEKSSLDSSFCGKCGNKLV
jgi:membrane protease subunit (stomatin/prohibitin family)